MKCVKKQKDMTLKDEFPRSGGVQYATGEEHRNSYREFVRDSGAERERLGDLVRPSSRGIARVPPPRPGDSCAAQESELRASCSAATLRGQERGNRVQETPGPELSLFPRRES